MQVLLTPGLINIANACRILNRFLPGLYGLDKSEISVVEACDLPK
jgi:hypothetical protein